MIDPIRIVSAEIDPGERVTLTCPLPAGSRAIHLDVDIHAFAAFELVHAESSAGGVHIEVRCRSARPAVFSGVLIVAGGAVSSTHPPSTAPRGLS